MNLRELNDKKLVEQTMGHVREERELLTNILHHFAEIQRRRLFCEYRFTSLYDMVMGYFGYSDDQACRRISAMKLLRELPEIESKISSGELSLTNLAAAQTLFRQEAKLDAPISQEGKIEILALISSKSTRDAEKILISHSSAPEMLKPDRVRLVSEKEIELRFTAQPELMTKISELKGLLAHSEPDIKLGKLFEKLCDLGLKEWRSAGRRGKARGKPVSSGEVLVSQRKSAEEVDREFSNLSERQKPSKDESEDLKSNDLADEKLKIRRGSVTAVRPAIRASVRRAVFGRAQDRCENCGSIHALQIEHVVPYARGGSDDVENLRLLCRSCNQRAAIQAYGQLKMDQFLG